MVAFSLVATGLVLFTALLTRDHFRGYLKDLIAGFQYRFISLLAEELDERFDDARDLLAETSRKIKSTYLAGGNEAKEFLERHQELLSVFNNGVCLTDKDGRVIAGVQGEAGGGMLLQGKTINVQEGHRGQGNISNPYQKGENDRSPVVMITVPVKGGSGGTRGFLAGEMDLRQLAFFRHALDMTMGKSGFVWLLQRDGTVIAHPDRSREFRKQELLYPLARGLEGFEGTLESRGKDGTSMLSSYHGLKTTGWVLVGELPVEEAFSAVNQAEKYVVFGLVPGLCLALFFLALLMRRLMEPLAQITRHVSQLPEKRGEDRYLRIDARDEAGELAAAFNRMLSVLDRQKEELERSEEKYRIVADFATDLSYWTSPEGEILYVSPACLRLTGYPDSDYYDNPQLLETILLEEDREKVEAQRRTACSGKEPVAVEVRIARREGSVRWFNHLCREVRSDTGRYLGIRGSFTDVTERKIAEQQQESQLQFLQSLIETIPNPVFYKNEAGLYEGCNSAFEKFLGKSKKEIIGKAVEEIAPPDLAQVYYNADQELFRTRGVQVYETSVMQPDGTSRDVIFYKATFSHGDGSLAGLIGVVLDITERKQMENALRESEEKFRLLFEESRDAIVVTDGDWTVVHLNQAAVELLQGIKCQTGDSLQEVFRGQPCAQLLEHGVEEDGYPGSDELRFSDGQGGTKVCLFSASRLWQGESGAFGFQFIFHDITDRKRAEERLRKNNLYLEALHETTLGIISRLDLTELLQATLKRAALLMHTGHGSLYLTNEQGRLVRSGSIGLFLETGQEAVQANCLSAVERAWETGASVLVDTPGLTGGASEEDGAVGAILAVPLRTREKVAGVFALAFPASQPSLVEEEVRVFERFAHLASLAIENAKLYAEAHRELQERKRAEQELLKVSHAVEQSPVAVSIIDPEGIVEYVNPQFEALTGNSAEQVVGKRLGIPEQEGFVEAMREGKEWRGECSATHKNGKTYWEVAHISPIRNHLGEITHFVVLQEDVTGRKALEAQLVHAEKMKAIGQLAGGIAHDFNNILTAIIGFATYMHLKIGEEPQTKNAVEQILAAAERGAGLVKGLLAFSRNQQTDMKPVSINTVVRRILRLLERLIGEDIALKVSFCRENPVIVADALQIEQVLMNLATNARDAMTRGGTLTIETEMVRVEANTIPGMEGFVSPGSYVVVRVADSGEGMDQETVKRIFEPFFTTKEPGKGTGLGMSIAYGIISKHRGHISCTSRTGEGTTFAIYLPEVPRKVEGDEAAKVIRLRGEGEKILLAEDDRVVRMVQREILEEFGYQVIEAEDGQDAVDKFRTRRGDIDLLLLDLVMPRKTGREVFEEIRAMAPGIRALFTSGYSPDVIERKGLLEQGSDYIEKSLAPHELLRKIREVLDR